MIAPQNNSPLQTLTIKEIELRALHPKSSTPRPFLRWAGSKRYVLKHLLELLPVQFNTYYEPFLGSGALFFLLRPSHAVLSDSCAELVENFIAVRENVEAVVRHITPLKPQKDLFYSIRDNRSKHKYKRAAEFIYLNKTCWNSLYRVNSDGVFNVPYGRPKTDFIIDIENLRACAKALQGTDISLRTSDFEESVSSAKEGDFVYFDPPYVTGHRNNGFIDYNEVLFSWKDQQRLAKVARDLIKRGVHVIISNADHNAILDLYPGFTKKTFERSSTLASDITKRKKVSEVILFSQE
jgi:DNA adenine methylase